MPPVSRFLTEQGIAHRVFRHAQPIHSLEEAARERNQAPGQLIRSILFRLSAENFFMVLAAGPGQISWPALRARFGQSRLTMASEQEVLAVTGYRIGTVSPLGLPAPLRMLADEAVFTCDEISIGSGERNVAVIMASADLRRLLPDLEIGHWMAA
ncbi:MAG: YbaK/EbsC family protein [Anaerolineales bacterium]